MYEDDEKSDVYDEGVMIPIRSLDVLYGIVMDELNADTELQRRNNLNLLKR